MLPKSLDEIRRLAKRFLERKGVCPGEEDRISFTVKIIKRMGKGNTEAIVFALPSATTLASLPIHRVR